MLGSITDAASGLLTGKSASSMASSLAGSAISNIFKDNINTNHSVKAFLSYYNSANSGANSELITNYWFIPIMHNFLPRGYKSLPFKKFEDCGFHISKCEQGELEYHILDVQMPQYSIETTVYSDMTGSYNRPSQSIANANSKTFTIQLLDTRLNLIDTVFANWISEVGSSYWSYPEQPYATCDFSVIIYTPGIKSGSIPGLADIPLIGSGLSNMVNGGLNNMLSPSKALFSAGKLNVNDESQLNAATPESMVKKVSTGNYNLVTYTFINCYPTSIELYSATNNFPNKFTRSVTFAFDTLNINAYYPVKSYNSAARILGGTLLKIGMPVVNKLLGSVGDKLNSVLDNTIGKLANKITDKINSVSNDIVSYGTNLNKPKQQKIQYTFKGNSGVTTGEKTSDISSNSIKRTFQTTF